MCDLIQNSRDLRQCDLLTITTNRGELSVINRIEKEDAVFIMSPEPVEKRPLPDTGTIADRLRINDGDIDSRHPISIINAGLATLLVL